MEVCPYKDEYICRGLYSVSTYSSKNLQIIAYNLRYYYLIIISNGNVQRLRIDRVVCFF